MAMGLLKFVVFACGLVYMLASMTSRPDLRTMFYPCLCTLAVIDLLPFNKNYSRQITEPFQRPEW